MRAPTGDVPLLARVVHLVARRAEEQARHVQQLAVREDDHQRRDQQQVQQQQRVGRQG
jgi:hypothetical protein